MAGDFTALYRQALERLSTGGKTLEASLQEIEEGKQQAIGRGQQSMVSGGLAGTTVMDGIPLQAEKIAATQRLGARGRAEEKYLTTLASFAAFAQRGQETAAARREASKERAAATQRLKIQLASQERSTIEAARGGGGGVGGTGGAGGRVSGLSGRVIPTGHSWSWDTPSTGGGQAQQFPATYGTTDTTGIDLPSAPSLGGPNIVAGQLEPPTGSVPYGQRTAPTAEDVPWGPTAQKGKWRNVMTGEVKYSATKPTGGYASAMWQYEGSG